MSRSDDGCRLFVGGLSMTTTDDSLRAYFASFYPVMFAEVRSLNTWKSGNYLKTCFSMGSGRHTIDQTCVT